MPTLQPLRRALPSILFAASIAVSLASCSKNRSATSSSLESQAAATRLVGPLPTPGSFPPLDLGKRIGQLPYPLAIGNQWDYAIHTRTAITTDTGPQPPVDSDRPWQVVITGVQVQDGRRYFQQSESDPRSMAPGPAAMFLVRQDRTGLFELDLPTPAPASGGGTSGARAPLTPIEADLLASVERMPAAAAHEAEYRRAALALGARVESALHSAASGPSAGGFYGPAPGEITLLRYPLFVGASWIVRDAPRFARRVVARDPLTVPAGEFLAWRIAGLSELYGPNDSATFWYGDPGLLRIQVHAEGDVTDNSGNIIGTLIFDSDQALTAVDLRGVPIQAFSAIAQP